MIQYELVTVMYGTAYTVLRDTPENGMDSFSYCEITVRAVGDLSENGWSLVQFDYGQVIRHLTLKVRRGLVYRGVCKYGSPTR